MNFNSRRCLLAILLVAFLLRLGAASYWHRTAQSEGRLFRLGDSHSYWTLASQLASGLPYQYESPESRIFRAPLYPLVLAPLASGQDPATGVWWARVLGCLLGTLAVAEIALLAWRFGGGPASLIAAGLAAVYPSAIGMSIIVLSEAIFIPLMLGHLLAWQSAWQTSSATSRWGYGLLAGGLAGAAVLARPSWLLFAPFAWAVGMLIGQKRARQTLILVASLIGLSCVMSPWWIRNARITGRFVPTTLQVGPSLLDGLHAGASGASDEDMAFMQPLMAEQMAEDAQQTEPLVSTLEYRVNARAQQAAVTWAKAHPVEVLVLAARKFLRIWTLWPDGGEINSAATRLAITLSSFSILLLALWYGSTLLGRFDWFYAICFVPSLYFTLLHMVFVGSVRYREPALLVLIPLAACGIARWTSYPVEPPVPARLAPQGNGIASDTPS
ncbi:MAG: glycosyltransferase family 39 protein [Pirellulaceae bacterium]|nr:glycosyltransferase family 39 protein [Pirellulaceae bacterium]